MRSAKGREINRRCKLACERMFIELSDDAANTRRADLPHHRVSEAYEMGGSDMCTMVKTCRANGTEYT